ncbi:MAG: formylglycine-generating enzyme family protein, partial [Planctomycetales bacterium]|nr:formylglycine-generating enzyme family protein [Planctomycetales bacterium]
MMSSWMLLDRELIVKEAAIQEACMVANVTAPHEKKNSNIKVLDHIQSLIAFEMMLQGKYPGRVTEKEQPKFLSKCLARFLRHKELDELGEELTDAKMRSHWKWAIVILKTIVFNYRSVFEHFGDGETGIAFRNRKTVELLAARYLTCYATEWDVFGQNNPDDHNGSAESRCAWHYTNDPEWKDCCLYAIDMPRHTQDSDRFPFAKIDPDVTCRSLSALFRLPPNEIRPTELMFRAWHLFELDEQILREYQFVQDRKLVSGADLALEERLRLGKELVLPGAEKVMEEFRESSRDLARKFENTSARFEDIPYHEPARSDRLERWRKESSKTKSFTFLPCPPPDWICAYEHRTDGEHPDPFVTLMGKNTDKEHLVRVGQFHIQATSVTWRQYREFDPRFLESKITDTWREEPISKILADFWKREKKSSEDSASELDMPVCCTTYWDAWIFCKWLGRQYQLPTECQLEFAIRGGSRDVFCFGDSKAQLDDYAWTDSNSGSHPHRVGQILPNSMGLFDGHGNLWEWGADYYDDTTYDKRRAKRVAVEESIEESNGPPIGRLRVMRGGSWNNHPSAVNLGASSRIRRWPEARYGRVGFRLASV